MKKLLIAISLFLSQSIFAAEVDVMFMPSSSAPVTVSGESDLSKEAPSSNFVATSENASEAFAKVRDKLEGSFAGTVEAEIIDAKSGAVEKVEFEGRYDQHTQIYYVVATLKSGQLFFWFEESR